MEFLPDGGQAVPSELGETMSRRPRRNHTHGEVDSDRHYSGRVRLLPPTLEATMHRTDLSAIFVSLELSRSTWLITSLSPDGGEKMSKHVVRGGDVSGLLERFATPGSQRQK